MPLTPEEQAAIAKAPASPAPAPTPTVTLTKGDQFIQVPEDQKYDMVAEGWDDPRFAEGGEYNPTLSGTMDNILARGEALDRGATGGLAGLAGSVGAAAVDQLMPAGGDIGQAAGPGLDAPQLEKSFGDSFHEAEQARRQRAEALGAEGYAWEAAGGLATLGAGTLAKGGSLGAKALLMGGANPVAIAEKLGTKAASAVLGEAAAAGILKTAGAKAVGGLVEGAITGAEMTAVENVDLALENPVEAAENVALGTLVGGTMGGVLGGGFGLVEGAARVWGGQAIPVLEQAAEPKPPVPAPRDVNLDQVVVDNQARPLVSAQVPDPQRTPLRAAMDISDAAIKGKDEAIAEGTRAVTRLADQSELLNMEARTEMGIAQKQLVNDIALQNGFADDIVDRVDPDDLMRVQDLQAQRDFVGGRRMALQSQFDDITVRHQDAVANEAAARKALDDAMSPVDERVKFTADQESAAQAALEASPDDPALRQAYADAQKARVTAETNVQKPRKPSAAELAPLREQLKTAEKELKALSKEFDNVKAQYGQADLDFFNANDAHLNAPAPRRMTRIESESRDMYDGLLAGIDAEIQKVGVGTGPDYQNLATFRKRVEAHMQASIDSFKRGDFGNAHNLMDQGLKDSIDDLITRAKGGELARFGTELYKVPQSFLENPQVWGPDIAGRNALANPAWHKGIVAANDQGFKSLYTTVGEDGYLGRGNRKGANSASVAALLKQLGDPASETQEAGVRNALRARNEDFMARANAWGTDRAKQIAAEHAKLQTHLEDILDNTAISIRDAAKAKSVGNSLTVMAGTAAVVGALTGTPALALPAVAGRWFISAVSKYKGNIMRHVSKGAAGLVSGTIRGAQGVGRVGNQTFARRMGAEQRKAALQEGGTSREQRIAEAKERLDITSPKFRALAREGLKTDALSPGLGSAMVEHQLKVDQYIVSKLPQPPSPTVFAPSARLTNAAATSLDRILIAVNNPIKTVDRIMGGDGTPEDLDAVRTLYPEVYKQMTDSIMAEIQQNPRRVKSASLQMYLSRVVGQPLTPALLRVGQAQERARKATQQAEEAGAPEGQGANGADGVTARAPISLSSDPNAVYGSRADRILNGM